jgi:hypothetical protein
MRPSLKNKDKNEKKKKERKKSGPIILMAAKNFLIPTKGQALG